MACPQMESLISELCSDPMGQEQKHQNRCVKSCSLAQCKTITIKGLPVMIHDLSKHNCRAKEEHVHALGSKSHKKKMCTLKDVHVCYCTETGPFGGRGGGSMSRCNRMCLRSLLPALALLLFSACCWADVEVGLHHDCQQHIWKLDCEVSPFNRAADDNLLTKDDDLVEDLSVSELLERANSNLIRSEGEPILVEGDIAIGSEDERNADPCTSQGCLWGKYTDGMVYVPYYIASHFSDREKAIIVRGLESFSSFSCIRFRPSRSSDRDWLSIESQNGCYSFVGRRGGKQVVSLARQGCLYHGTVQHELLHALGFNHEQTRSDRDNHIRVLLQNVQSGMEHNFRKIATLNQGTPYDYNSVMQYHKYAFSKNNQPTMLPIPDPNVSFGNAKEMSRIDIQRLTKLYKC
nr:hatching enzyme 1.2-like [Nothobranchius furzeri]